MQFLPETSEALSCPQCVFKDCTTQHPHSHLLPSPRFCTQILMICCLREDLTIRIVAIWSPLLECEYCSTGVSSKRKKCIFFLMSHYFTHSSTQPPWLSLHSQASHGKEIKQVWMRILWEQVGELWDRRGIARSHSQWTVELQSCLNTQLFLLHRRSTGKQMAPKNTARNFLQHFQTQSALTLWPTILTYIRGKQWPLWHEGKWIRICFKEGFKDTSWHWDRAGNSLSTLSHQWWPQSCI